MRIKLTAPLRNVLSSESRQSSDVHFHMDGAGRPFVCDHGHCESPRLSGREVGLNR